MKQFLFKTLDSAKNLLIKIGINKRIPGTVGTYAFLAEKFWPYPEVMEIQGSKMYLNVKNEPSSIRETFLVYATQKIHEKTTTALFKENVKSGNVVVDLGANIGYFTLLASQLVGKGGKVFCFEPEPRNFRFLSKNIEINNYTQALAFPKAVSDKNGKTQLFVCDYDTGHHTINQHKGIESYSRGRETKEHAIEIETVTLDSFLEGRTDHVDVIKMDVEGAEMLALTGMDRILRDNKDIKMFIEFFPLLIRKMGSSPEEFIRKLLEDYKFSIFIIPDDYNASAGGMAKADSVKDVMRLINEEADHINMFLKRQ